MTGVYMVALSAGPLMAPGHEMSLGDDAAYLI